MSNLFSVFDPQTSFFSLSLNWASALIVLFLPSLFWVQKTNLLLLNFLISSVQKEIKLNLGLNPTPGLTHFFLSFFIFILLNNFFGLFPYIFTASSHLTFTLTLSLSTWLGYMIFSFVKDVSHSLAHFTPLGTPSYLIPFMVIIEIVSNIIRPITLSVRLTANMVAGHLLLVILATPLTSVNLLMMAVILLAVILLLILELAVSVVQSFVFSTLISLYVAEVNSFKL